MKSKIFFPAVRPLCVR